MNQKNIALHKSIAQWAQEIGSVAKTHNGQLRAVSNYIAEYEYVSFTQRGNMPNQGNIRNYKTSRVVNSADRRAAILGYPVDNSDWSDYCAAYDENDLRAQCVRDWADKTVRSISVPDALSRKYRAAWNENVTYILLSPTKIAKIVWDENADWEYYSKRYNHPKNTVTNRRVDFFELTDTEITVSYSFPVDDFRGDFLRGALLAGAEKLGLPQLRDSVISYYAAQEQRRIEGREVYKIVKQVNLTDFVSIYNPDYIYRLGEKIRETAQPAHGGGLYVWATLLEAEEQLGNGEIYCNGDTILRCIARGKILRYDNDKIAVSELTPVAVVARSTKQEEN